MSKLKKSVLLLVLISLTQPLLAQIRSLSGTIRNAATLEPLPYANIVIKGTYLGGTSNVDGYFYLSGLDHDSVQVVSSYIGYAPFSQWLYFTDETHIIIPIAMQPQTLGGEEVLVEDSLLVTPEVKVTSQIPLPEQPVKIDLKQSDAQVDAYTFPLSAPMQWLHPTGEFTNYIIDGVPVANNRHLYNVYPAFNLDAVKHIESHAAGNIKQTCTDQVGATELIYKEGNRASVDVQAELGLAESGLTTSGPHPANGSWYFSGRRVDFDAIYSLSTIQEDSVYREFRPDYYFYDLNGKVTFNISDVTKVSGNMYLTFDKLHWLGNQGRSAHSSWYNGLLSARLQHRFSPKLSTQTLVYGKTYHSFLRADDIPMGLGNAFKGDFINAQETYGFSSQADYYLGQNNMIAAGLSLEAVNAGFKFVDSTQAELEQGTIFKFKTGYRYTLPYNLSADLGVQTVYSSFSEAFAMNPSFLINWEPSNIYNAYFSMVQSTPVWREISFSNTLSQPLLDVMLPVDTSLAAPEKVNISLGGSFMPIIGYSLQGSFFTELLSAPVLMDTSWQGKLDTQADWLMAFDKGTLTGFDLSLEKLTPGFRGLAKYRYSHATLTDQAGDEIMLPGHREHEFYFVVDGKFRENMGYQMDLTVASGKRYMDGAGDWQWSPSYHRLDVEVYRDIAWKPVQGRVSAGLVNITNQSNLKFEDSAWISNSLQDRAFVLLPFLPTVKFDLVF